MRRAATRSQAASEPPVVRRDPRPAVCILDEEPHAHGLRDLRGGGPVLPVPDQRGREPAQMVPVEREDRRFEPGGARDREVQIVRAHLVERAGVELPASQRRERRDVELAPGPRLAATRVQRAQLVVEPGHHAATPNAILVVESTQADAWMPAHDMVRSTAATARDPA